jgi:hypothetical protein
MDRAGVSPLPPQADADPPANVSNGFHPDIRVRTQTS